MSVRNAAIWSIAAQYTIYAVQFVQGVVIARYFLSPGEVGVYSIALSAAMILAIFQDFGVTRYLIAQPTLDKRMIGTCFLVSVVLAVAISAIIAAIALPVSHAYGMPDLFPLLLIIAGSYLLSPLSFVPVAVMQRQLEFKSLFIVNMLSALVCAAVAVGLAAEGASSFSLGWAGVAQQLVRAAAAHWLCPQPISLDADRKSIVPILRFGGGMSLLYLSGAVGGRSADLVVGKLLGAVPVGLYSRAASIADQAQSMVSGALGAVLYPVFVRIRDSGEPMAMPYLRVVAGYTAVSWPTMLLLAIYADPIVLLLFGERWIGVARLMQWIAVSQMVFSAAPLHMEVPIVMSRLGTLLRLNYLDATLAIGFLAVGAAISLEAAAQSRVVYGLCWLAIYLPILRSLTGFRVGGYLAVLLQGLAATGFAVAPAVATELLVADVEWPLAMAAIALALPFWVLGLWVVRHPARDELIALTGQARDMWQQRRAPMNAVNRGADG